MSLARLNSRRYYVLDIIVLLTITLVAPTLLDVNNNGKYDLSIDARREVKISIHFEDGFGSGDFRGWGGTSTSNGETVNVVNTLAHHSIYSAKFSSNGDGRAEKAYCYETIPSASELYARGYFRVAVSGIADESDRFFFLVFKAGTEKVAFAGWRRTAGIVKWCLIIRHGLGWAWTTSTTSHSLDRWYRVELHWNKDSAAGSGEFWVDGALMCSVTGKNTAYFGDVRHVDFGLAEIMYCGSTTVYSDCCALANTYIGPS